MLLLPGQTGIQRERREPEDGPESGRGRPSPRSKGHGGYPSGRGRQRLGSSSTKRSARLQVTQGRAKLGLRDAYCTAPTGNVICLGIFRSQRCPLHTRRGCTMPSQNTVPLSRISRIRAECRRRCKASIPEPKRNRAGGPRSKHSTEKSLPRRSHRPPKPSLRCGSSEPPSTAAAMLPGISPIVDGRCAAACHRHDTEKEAIWVRSLRSRPAAISGPFLLASSPERYPLPGGQPPTG